MSSYKIEVVYMSDDCLFNYNYNYDTHDIRNHINNINIDGLFIYKKDVNIYIPPHKIEKIYFTKIED